MSKDSEKNVQILGISKDILKISFPGVHLDLFKSLFRKEPRIQLNRLVFSDSIQCLKKEPEKEPESVDIDLGEIDLCEEKLYARDQNFSEIRPQNGYDSHPQEKTHRDKEIGSQNKKQKYNFRKRNVTNLKIEDEIESNSESSDDEVENSDPDFEYEIPHLEEPEPDESEAEAFRNSLNRNKEFQCPNKKCGRKFAYENIFQIHLLTHKEKKALGLTSCPICNRKCLTRDIFHRHIRTSHHPKPDPELAEFSEQNKILVSQKLRCEFKGCRKRFTSKAKLSVHYRSSHPKRGRRVCPRCGLRMANFKIHLKERCSKREYPYICPEDECPRKLPNKIRYELHKLEHAYPDFKKDFKAGICSFCKKKLSKSDAVKTHILRCHLGMKPARSIKKIKIEKDPQKCPICSKMLKHKPSLKLHLTSAHGPYKCNKCYLRFAQRESLLNHRKIHGSDLKCKICGRELGSRPSLRNHIDVIHRKIKKFECQVPECGKKFGYKSDLDYHQKIHLTKIKFPQKCDPCDGLIAYKLHTTLRKHQKRHHSGKSLKNTEFGCEKCSKKFAIKLVLELHRLEHEYPNLKKMYQDGICGICGQKCDTMNPYVHLRNHFKWVKCSVIGCGRKVKNIIAHELKHKNSVKCPHANCTWQSISNINYLSNHLKTKHASYKCTFIGCTQTFIGKCKLNRHLEDKHQVKPVCEKCGKKFATKKILLFHILNVHEKKEHSFKCEVPGCEKKYSTKSRLGSHLKSSHKSKQICEFCGAIYKNKLSLNAHINQIHLEKFPCTWVGCGAKLSSKTSLARHLKSHFRKEERQKKIAEFDGPKFPCEKCDKIYTQAQSLRFHMRTVHVDKKFSCKFKDCGKSFPEKSYLKTHEEVHNKERIQCQFCEKTFTKYMLKLHVLDKHKKERDCPFKCKECGDTFVRKKILENHMQKYHNCKNIPWT